MKAVPKSPYRKLKERERAARRTAIIEAAERVFARKPFDQVSIRDIAREAGISHALIYRYFADKQSLFVEAFLRGVEELMPLIDKAAGKGLEAVAETYLKFLVEHDELFRMMTHFMLDGTLKGESLTKLNAVARSLLDRLNCFFEKEEKEKNSTKQQRLLAHAFFAALNGVLISFRDYPGRKRKEVLMHMGKLGNIIAQNFTR